MLNMKKILVITGAVVIVAFFAYLIPNMLVPGIFNTKSSSLDQNSSSKDLSSNPIPSSYVKNNQDISNKNTKIFVGSGFSFQYDSKAVAEKGRDDFFPELLFYRVYEKNSKANDDWKEEVISFQTSIAQKCGEGIKLQHGITIDKKGFSYCEYPKTIGGISYVTKVYIYDIDVGTDLQIIANVNNEKPNTYFIPESVKIK